MRQRVMSLDRAYSDKKNHSNHMHNPNDSRIGYRNLQGTMDTGQHLPNSQLQNGSRGGNHLNVFRSNSAGSNLNDHRNNRVVSHNFAPLENGFISSHGRDMLPNDMCLRGDTLNHNNNLKCLPEAKRFSNRSGMTHLTVDHHQNEGCKVCSFWL